MKIWGSGTWDPRNPKMILVPNIGNIISKFKKKGPTSFFSLQINFNGKFERITNPKKPVKTSEAMF